MAIAIVSSCSERPASDPRPVVPPDAEFFHDLHRLDHTALRELGMRPWNDPDACDDDAHRFGYGMVLWLFPGEWHASIPDGFPIVGILGARSTFDRDSTPAHTQVGCLAYGILVKRSA